MSDLLPVQRDLARLLFSLPEAAGYALAGGAALVVRQIVDRGTRDLDAFIAATPGPTPDTVDLLADACTNAAQRAGWTLQLSGHDHEDVLIHVAASTFPVGGTQILLHDADIPQLTWGFAAAVVSMALQWHSTSVLRFRVR